MEPAISSKTSSVLINLDPLIKHRDFRWLFLGQAVSTFGGYITYVAVPYQVYELTKSSTMVGLVSVVQLVPLLVSALIGGAYADVLERRKLLINVEIIFTICSLLLVANSLLPEPSHIAIFILAGLISAINGFHRPALDAITQVLVPKEDMPAVAALGSLRYTLGAIAGPAAAGVLIASFGIAVSYAVDAFTFLFSLYALVKIKGHFGGGTSKVASFKSIAEGLSYAKSRPELLGTYFIDIAAMIFAMPMALFPAMAKEWGGPTAAGWLFAAMPIGSAFIAIFSGWTSKVQRHGAAIILSAIFWGLAIFGLGFATNLWLAVFFLAVAGAFDSISGVFRAIIWNQTIPTDLRGRMSGIEMISYMSGPLLGNARAGYMADMMGIGPSIAWGGATCSVAVLICAFLIPSFWKYERR